MSKLTIKVIRHGRTNGKYELTEALTIEKIPFKNNTRESFISKTSCIHSLKHKRGYFCDKILILGTMSHK